MTAPEATEVYLPAAAVVAVNRGRLLEAIRITRESETGLGLKEARERVEAYVAQDPMLKERVQQQQADTRRRIVRWVIVFDVLLVAFLLWWFFLR